METEELNLQLALRAFSKIVQLGSKQGDATVYQGIRASSDFDGYTVNLANDQVSLTIFFHSQHKLEYRNKFALDEFLQQLKRIDKIRTDKNKEE